jgi:hypothetical protein
MIRKSGSRFSEKIMRNKNEHDPQKACLGHRSGGGNRFYEKIMRD